MAALSPGFTFDHQGIQLSHYAVGWSYTLGRVEERGYILIADITGYTAYLNRSELDHARGTLSDLLGLLVEHTRPPLVMSQLEGDAVMSYGLEKGFFSGQTFLEMVEDTYVAFRRAIELMVLNNSCRCNACANVSALDLKFFLHHGSFAFQKLDDREQILGSDVNLVHRLLKNSVTEATGFKAYMLCTEPAIDAIGLTDSFVGMVRHVEEVDDFGPVEVWVMDMHPVYQARRHQHDVVFEDNEVIDFVETEVGLPPELVWDYVNQSDFRDVLIGSDRHEVQGLREGRIGPGSTFQCYHGNRTVPQVVVEWRPFERVVFEMLTPLPGKPTRVLFDFRLAPTEKGTRLSSTIARATGPAIQRSLARWLLRRRHRTTLQELESFRDAIERDVAHHGVRRDHPAVKVESIEAAASSALRGLGRQAPD